jgi:hypothetical protein
MFNLYRGEGCQGSETGILGDYSYWLNGAYLPGRYRFACRNPGPDAEPNPNEWIAGGEFSWGGTWRVDCTLTVLGKTTVKVEGSIRWLNPATRQLEIWTTFSKTMEEDNPQGITDPRRHRIFKSGKIEITPNAASGGIGDPVTHLSMVLGTRPLIVGCGTELCAMWDGNHYYTCFRAEVADTGAVPGLSQMGKSQQPCGGKTPLGQYQPWCNCDRITLSNIGHRTYVNSDPDFAEEYGYAGNPPLEVEQQVQIGGGLLMKRWGDGPTKIFTKDISGTWVEGTWTVTQEFGPTIWTVNFGTPVFRSARLYALAFPNPGILPDECVPDPAPPSPDRWVWYCVDGTCIQANTRPPNATDGPFDNMAQCEGSQCAPPPPKKWYCVNGACGEYDSAPTGATGGPWDTKAECEAGCQPPPPESKWYCVNGACVQSSTVPQGATGGPFNTQAECQGNCQALPPTPPWWCIDGACQQSATQPPGSTGPFQSMNECQGLCQPPPPATVYVCQAGQCVQMSQADAEASGFQFFTFLADCTNACEQPENPHQGYYCVPETNPAKANGTGNFTCIAWGDPNGPPANTQGGKYSTLEECAATCGLSEPTGIPYWCAAAADGSRGCIQAETAPPSVLSGPYLNQTVCFESCITLVDPAPLKSAPVVQMRSSPAPWGNQERFWLPCIHRGEEIPDTGFT